MLSVDFTATYAARELCTLGRTLIERGLIREAALQFRQALGIDPDFPDALLCLGHCLHTFSAHDEALALYDRLLALSPGSVAGWNNRGNTLLEMCRHDEAAASYSRALALAPALHDSRVALATCYQSMGLVEQAMAACNAVLAAAPDHAEAHWNRSLLLLLKGDYDEGWREYEWRWRKRNFTSPPRNFSQPRWQGETPAGKTVLVHAEQGFGDTLQFCRYVSMVAALGADVIFECHPPLAPLMESLHKSVKVIPMGMPLPPFDLHVPLLSLPMVFGTTVEMIPATVPYLSPPADRLPPWYGMIPSTGFKIGVCWAGKAYPDPRRSCPPEQLAPLSAIEGVSVYSLQVEWDKALLPASFINLTGHVKDFGDTAALISGMDLIITVDTAVAHLAGALGKTAWLMLPYAPDWRWMLNRADSPWYPSMRLFRQAYPGSWEDVLGQIVGSLRNFYGNG